MTMDLENRASFLSTLGQFITDAEGRLTTCLESLKWSKEVVKKKFEEGLVSCPLNRNHTMPARSLDKHLDVCAWISEGYTREEKETSVQSSDFFYTDATAVHKVNIDKPLLNHILQSMPGVSKNVASAPEKEVPRTANRAITDFSSDQRWAVYDYVVAQGRAANKLQSIKPEDLQLNFERRPAPHTEKSLLETLAEQRDYRRRRQSYRAKNVHITKKSYTEVMKEVIENHMQILLENSGGTRIASPTTPEPSSPPPSGQSSGARDDSHRQRAPSIAAEQDASRQSPRHSRHSSRDRSEQTWKDDQRHSRHQKNSERSRRERSNDDSRRSRHKRRRSRSRERSEIRSSKVKQEHDGESSTHRHHHKKSSHKSHKRHHRSRSKD